MLPNWIVSVSFIQKCNFPSLPLFFTKTMKFGALIHNHNQKGKGWEEKSFFYFSNSVGSDRRHSQNPLGDKNHQVMFHVNSYPAFEVLDRWERTNVFLQLFHKLWDSSFLGDQETYIFYKWPKLYRHTYIHAHVYIKYHKLFWWFWTSITQNLKHTKVNIFLFNFSAFPGSYTIITRNLGVCYYNSATSITLISKTFPSQKELSKKQQFLTRCWNWSLSWSRSWPHGS